MAEFVLSGQELFGRYARIAYGHALDGKQDYHIYKCIRSFMSNCYCDVPLTYQTENNCHTHDNIVEVVNVIHCGIDENRVIRVARNDIELLPAAERRMIMDNCRQACPYNTLYGCKVKEYNAICPLTNMAKPITEYKMTNADRILSMSDEELAENMSDWQWRGGGLDPKDWLEWLQQPAE